ncbi:AAA family ATPase [Geminicoccus flavidas]|uniref:AAA family ATPase n=1 Tax=Geminicoccus flavidas TaxID=2506407 RepID=UPI00135B811A|nr:AAA family ATPase [Geminicoccus flavidas]
MRIRAIRGQNLTSLVGPFELDFEAEPLRSAGIFAISGPTGAGKSTLLDAMCLALFDRLPRFDHADREKIGEREGEQVQYNDVRHVLRHGAAEAFAEVDFAGQDGRDYRSRWQLRRARGRSDGRLQAQSITLTDLATGQVIGDKKIETLAEIERRVGLSFDQFRRAVLLAQGDFDTFIRANAKERAELLERITGTFIYAELSRAAFQRKKQEEQALALLDERIAGAVPLPPEERQAAEAAEAAAKAVLDELDQTRAGLERERAWHEQDAKLAAHLAEAEAAAAQAQAAHAADDGARAALALHERALTVRPQFDERARCARELAELAAREQPAAKACYAATAEAEAAGAASRDAAELLADVQREADRLAPLLAEARAMDVRLERAEAAVAAAETEQARRLAERTEAEAALQRLNAAHAEATAALAEHRAWLDAHPGLHLLAGRIGPVLQDLAAATEHDRRLAELAERKAELARQRQVLAEASAGRMAELAELRRAVQADTAAIAGLQAEISAIDRPAVQERLDRCRQLRSALEALEQADGEAKRIAATLAELGDELAKLEASATHAAGEQSLAEAALPAARARLDEARRGLDLSEAAAGDAARHLRLQLQPGQPCPVCGATEHAAAPADQVLAERVLADRQRVAELEEASQALQRRSVEAATLMRACADQRPQLERQQAAARAEQARWQERRDAALADLTRHGEGLLPEHPGQDPARHLDQVEQLTREASAQLAHLAELEARLGRAQSALAERRDRLDGLAAAGDQAAEQERDLALEAERSAERLRATEAERAAVLARLAELLDGPCVAWRDQYGQDAQALAGQCRELAAAWTARTEALEACRAKIGEFGEQQGAARTTLAHRQRELQEAESVAARCQQEWQALRDARARLLDGAADAAEQAMQARLARAQAAHAQAGTALVVAERTLAVAKENVAAAGRAHAAGKVAAAEAERRLADALAELGLELADAEAAFARPEGWAEAERARLQGLANALEEQRVTCRERQRILEEHRASGIPARAVETIQEALAELAGRREAAEAIHRERLAVLINDDRIGKGQLQLIAEREARRRQADVWLRLASLIGSADGAKFRRFAQNLTLVQLLHLANLHLAELHPRYELQRAPGGDLVLQVVDRFMADEVRGVHSLSGGERFLVSLALALGLASLSSGQGIRVESLFIDEGFGALDAQSLGMALSVLERLQATGRRVGVISHVEEMKERIAVRVEVTPQGSGRSTLTVTSS